MIFHSLGFQHFPRDLANANEWKIMFDRYYCINSAKHCENVLCVAPKIIIKSRALTARAHENSLINTRLLCPLIHGN